MAEVFKASFLVNNISPDDCYSKAIKASEIGFLGFVLWKQRPTARLFGLQKKNDQFSTINFFLTTEENGILIEARFNTKKYSTDEIELLFSAFKNEMMKA